jgi:hypothetical protein
MGVSGGDTGGWKGEVPGSNRAKWVSAVTTTVLLGGIIEIARYGDPANREKPMKTTIKYIAPWLAAAAIGGAIGLAPVASAAPGTTPVPQTKVAANPAPAPAPTPFESGTDPLVPGNVGADPYIPYTLGDPYLRNPAGGVDLAF